MEATEKSPLNPDDVWKNFKCPKYITRPCPGWDCLCPKPDKLPKDVYNFCERSQIDINYTLQKLHELISDRSRDL